MELEENYRLFCDGGPDVLRMELIKWESLLCDQATVIEFEAASDAPDALAELITCDFCRATGADSMTPACALCDREEREIEIADGGAPVVCLRCAAPLGFDFVTQGSVCILPCDLCGRAHTAEELGAMP